MHRPQTGSDLDLITKNGMQQVVIHTRLVLLFQMMVFPQHCFAVHPTLKEQINVDGELVLLLEGAPPKKN